MEDDSTIIRSRRSSAWPRLTYRHSINRFWMPTDLAGRSSSINMECMSEPTIITSTFPESMRLEQTYLSRPWPTAIILLLSPSHARSFLPHQIKSIHGHSQPDHHKLTSSQRWPYALPSAFDLHQRYPKFSLNHHVNQSTITKKKNQTHQSHSHLQKHSNTPKARTWPQWHYVHDRGTSSNPPKAAISPNTNPNGEKEKKIQKNRGVNSKE